MDKDIDDLLDEVEQKFVVKKKSSSSTTTTAKSGLLSSKPDQKVSKQAIKPRKSKSGLEDDIDAILDLDIHIQDDNVSRSRSSNSNRSNFSSSAQSQTTAATATVKSNISGGQRCYPVYLGGSKDVMGRGSSLNSLACDQLRCTACDFRVIYFDNMAWQKETDYLFLRNNVPDFKRLKPRLSNKRNCRAYCCQCQWRNVSEIAELKDPQLKWVCGKHSL